MKVKELVREYENISAKQLGYGALTVCSIVLSVLMWFICEGYDIGKLFVLVAGGATTASLAAAVVYQSIRKKIAMWAILRSLGARGAKR